MQGAAGPDAEEVGDEFLPRGIQYLVKQIDAFAVRRPNNRRLPVILLKRDSRPTMTEPVADTTATQMIVRYRDRLRRRSTDLVGLVPHAFIDDAGLPRGRAGGQDGAGEPETHIVLLKRMAKQLERSMPPGSGRLRLPRFHTCLKILNTTAGDGPAPRRRLRDRLYEDLAERRPWLGVLAKLADAQGKNALTGFPLRVFEMLVVGLPRWVYGVWLSRGRAWRWVGPELRIPGGDFLKVALEIAEDGDFRDDDALVQRILLMALLRDLDKAVRPSRFWIYRARRPWPFVLLLGSVGDEDTPSRSFLDTYVGAAPAETSSPLMVLGAVTGKVPSYAVPITPDPRSRRPSNIADQVRDLYTGRSADLSAEGVYLVPLSHEDDDAAARQWLRTHFEVPARAAGGGDYVRPVLSLLVPVVLVAAGLGLFVVNRQPSPCHPVATGEVVGVTDGRECTLAAPGPEGLELRELEKAVARQNALVDLNAPYRSVVFFAPLSVSPRTGDTAPNGLQSLRGAVTAQSQVNGRDGKYQMRIRLLIANAGQYFTYGASNPRGPDVAQEIISRVDKDHIAAVIGITQSRPASLEAVKELDAAQIPVVGSSVTGSKMVDYESPSRYFQVSPPNSRIAQVMAEFARHSEQVRNADAPAPRAVVVVYDPHDGFFSTDLKDKFAEYYRGADIEPIAYSEQEDGQRTSDVARAVCGGVRSSRGFVVYAGRSAVMPDLFNAMQDTAECHQKRGRLIVIAESTAAKFLDHPDLLAKDYPFLSLYYVAFNASGTVHGQDGYGRFSKQFSDLFRNNKANSDAAGGYDALNVVSKVINLVYPQYPDANFRPSEVYAQLANPGVPNYLGASGVLSLGGGHKYPLNKAVYMLQPKADGTVVTLMACGLLPDQENPSAWGPAGNRFPCPKEE
ncbi:hypothetical protein AB0O34_27295 [Sphaerisporangium sp. NPDC088356]|uniref:ABC transporter substrate-binding protein n=1 Tax=Sphaerisporangium sp. NPDC088356 TaxID=3154871 RepID=UPI0034355456